MKKSCKGIEKLKLIYILEMNRANITISENALEDDITLEWYGRISQRWINENRTTALRTNSIGSVHQYPSPKLKEPVDISLQ